MQKIKKNLSRSFLEMSTEDICSFYKSIGINDARIAYDNYLIDTCMRPSLDSKEFQEIFKKATKTFFFEEVDFSPNVYDNLRKLKASATRNKETRVWSLLWEDGTFGTYPPSSPPDFLRFNTIKKHECDYNC
jgi:hypothetical protein